MKDHSNEEQLKLEPKRIEEASETDEKRFQCAVCGKESSTSSLLKAHEKIHNKESYKHICKVCGKTFYRSENLKSHENIHGDPKYQCKDKECGKKSDESPIKSAIS